jgi:hypothetical protein
MTLGEVSYDIFYLGGGTYLTMKLYASPGGGANMITTDTTQCSKRPMNGVLKGLLLAQSRENGRIPSRPISCTTIRISMASQI